MNYQLSKEILEKIKASGKILLSCHHHPDSDTVGCATVLFKVLKDMGKDVTIICPDKLPDFLSFIENSGEVQYHRFEEFDFSPYDLYIVCDTASWSRLFVDIHFTPPTIPVIVIDNHSSNLGFGQINLLDYKTSSVCEMLYGILEDWGVEVTKNMATSLLAGILGDTGSFQFEVHKNTFHIADLLVQKGAERDVIDFHLFNNMPLELIEFWGVAIQNLKVDEAGFAYVALPFETYKPFMHLYGTRETIANLIISKIAKTKFGFILTGDSTESSSVSFRSRTDVDVAKLAVSLGGGGHPGASGAWLRGMSFDQALEKTLAVCREVAA